MVVRFCCACRDGTVDYSEFQKGILDSDVNGALVGQSFLKRFSFFLFSLFLSMDGLLICLPRFQRSARCPKASASHAAQQDTSSQAPKQSRKGENAFDACAIGST